MLDRNGYVVVTVTERAMMLMMVTTAAMIVVERFSFSGGRGESLSPQIHREKKTSWKVAGSSQLSLFDDVNAERHDEQEGHCQVDVISGERPRVVENSKVWDSNDQICLRASVGPRHNNSAPFPSQTPFHARGSGGEHRHHAMRTWFLWRSTPQRRQRQPARPS